MPAPEVAFLNDPAILWEFAGLDRDNEPTILTPYEINVRWDASRTKVIGQDGQLINTDVQIIADQQVPIGSIMWQGIWEDLDDPPINLFRVVYASETPDIRGGEKSFEYSLARFNNTLPDIVGTS